MTFSPCDRFTLPNGLRVLVAPDHTTPAVAVSVHYDVGTRSEPEGRSGFAHLFEHLMFQGSESAGKLQHSRLIQGAGGTFNGTTTSDYTVYHDVVPAEALETALFLEADRMRAPLLNDDHLRNQVDVVKEEILGTVLGQPYGQFPVTRLRPLLFSTFPNSHDGWGDFTSLHEATLEECAAFFDTYYAPGNAVLTIAGNVTTSEAQRLVERHFGDVPSREVSPPASFDELAPTATRRGEHVDPLAQLPAVAIGYRMPDPIAEMNDYLAHLALIEILTGGHAGRLPRRMVYKAPQLAVQVYGATFSGPFHVRHPDAFSVNVITLPNVDTEQILDIVDEELDQLAQQPPTPDEVTKATTMWTAAVYQQLDNLEERARGLGLFELLHGQAELLPRMPQHLATVTPDAITAAAKALRPDSRAVLSLIPGAAA